MSVDNAAEHIFGFVIMNDWSGMLLSYFWCACGSYVSPSINRFSLDNNIPLKVSEVPAEGKSIHTRFCFS